MILELSLSLAFRRLGRSHYFSKMDCASGFWQLLLSREDAAKTAFVTTEGQFEYNVLPFDSSKTTRLDPAIRPSLTRGRKSFTYLPGQTRIPEGASPDIKNKSWSITADVSAKSDT